MSDARTPSLVDVEWARKNVGDRNVRFVEVDVDTGLYAEGHIPGAVAWSWTTQLQDPVRRDLASRDAVAALLAEAGVDDNVTVVLYGDHDNWFAAYGFWLLAYHGFPLERLRLLDGGRKAWTQAGGPLVADRPSYPRAEVRLGPTRAELRATREDVLAVAQGERRQALVDVRSPDEFTGKILAPPGLPETAQRGGHVPGAANVPWARAVDPVTGAFRSREELEALYGAAGATAEATTIAYCRIGERSSHTWFALTQVLGWPAANYDGSWTEYGNLVGAPIAR